MDAKVASFGPEDLPTYVSDAFAAAEEELPKGCAVVVIVFDSRGRDTIVHIAGNSGGTRAGLQAVAHALVNNERAARSAHIQ